MEDTVLADFWQKIYFIYITIMRLSNFRNFSSGNIPSWVKKHPVAMVVSGVLALWWYNIGSSYRWFYDIKSSKFREITIEYINSILMWEHLSWEWKCIYNENRLRIGIIFCELKNGGDFWPKTFELKWLNQSMYTCINLRLQANWLIDTTSGNCFQGRMTLLGNPEYYDNTGKKIDPKFIPWNSYPVPPQANQW